MSADGATALGGAVGGADHRGAEEGLEGLEERLQVVDRSEARGQAASRKAD